MTPLERMMEELVGTGDGLHVYEAMPVFAQCECGKWQARLMYDNGVLMYMDGAFDTRHEAALFLVDIMDLAGVDFDRQLQRVTMH